MGSPCDEVVDWLTRKVIEPWPATRSRPRQEVSASKSALYRAEEVPSWPRHPVTGVLLSGSWARPGSEAYAAQKMEILKYMHGCQWLSAAQREEMLDEHVMWKVGPLNKADVEDAAEGYRRDWIVKVRGFRVHGHPMSVNAVRIAYWKRTVSAALQEHPRMSGLDAPSAFRVVMDFRISLGVNEHRPSRWKIGRDHDKKPDIDNLYKPVMDVMNKHGCFGADDCVVSRPNASKVWAGIGEEGVDVMYGAAWLSEDEIREAARTL